MLTRSAAEDIIFISIMLQSVITASFWIVQCVGLQAKTVLSKAGRCSLFTLLHIVFYGGVCFCFSAFSPTDALGSLIALLLAVSLSCMVGLLWKHFTAENRRLRSGAAMLLLLDVVAVFGFALYFDFKGQEDALSNGTILILTLLNYICFYAITVRRSEQS